MKIQHFKDLIAWQKAHKTAVLVYSLSKKFPKEEFFALTSQIRRSVVSITSNIAEGFGRSTLNDKNHFFTMAKGSANETESQLLIAKDLGYITLKECTEVEQQLVEIQKILAGLMKSSFNK